MSSRPSPPPKTGQRAKALKGRGNFYEEVARQHIPFFSVSTLLALPRHTLPLFPAVLLLDSPLPLPSLAQRVPRRSCIPLSYSGYIGWPLCSTEKGGKQSPFACEASSVTQMFLPPPVDHFVMDREASCGLTRERTGEICLKKYGAHVPKIYTFRYYKKTTSDQIQSRRSVIPITNL